MDPHAHEEGMPCNRLCGSVGLPQYLALGAVVLVVSLCLAAVLWFLLG